jgi:hypothetical protein
MVEMSTDQIRKVSVTCFQYRTDESVFGELASSYAPRGSRVEEGAIMHRAAATRSPKAFTRAFMRPKERTSFIFCPPTQPSLSPSVTRTRNKKAKTYNSGYSLVVTHLTTNPPVHCLSTAERTGSSIFSVLWSYVEVMVVHWYITHATNSSVALTAMW